jgi:small subunit ribosomal protein S8e
MTKLGPKKISLVRVRGGNIKRRALRLDSGNFSWGSESVTRKTRILGVVYNASNNELVRTNTLVKGAIIQVDATPFRQWYEKHYGVVIGKQKKKPAEGEKPAAATEKKEGEQATTGAATTPAAAEGSKKQSDHVKRKLRARQKERSLEPALEEQFNTGRLYAAISSRPGQCGRADGYILEGRELDFYLRKLRGRRGGAEKK